MEELLKKAQELVAGLNQEKAFYAEKSKEQEAIRLKLERAQIELANRDQALRVREDAVKNIENAQALEQQAREVSLNNQAEDVRLQKETDTLAVKQKALNEKTLEIRKDQELVDKGNDLLKKGLEDLKVAKENYKKEVLANLQNTKI